MDYYEITFRYDSPVETGIINDLLASELGKIGFESFVSEDNGLLAYINTAIFNDSLLNECLCNFPLEGINFFQSQQLIKSRNWNEEWEKNYFQPIVIDNDCRICASFHPEIKGFRYSIVIDPKMAFGTGNHATTYLMLTELLKLDLKEKSFLDMGCGTAILAILAAMKGASKVVAIDIDELAFNNAVDNCRLNHTEQIEVVLGGAGQIARSGMFDYIFANINRNVLVNDICHYAQALEPEGSLFMSGFFKEDITAIEKESNRNGLFLCVVEQRDHWISTQFRKGLKSDK